MTELETTGRFFVLSGRAEPVILVDENGDPASFSTGEEARESADRTPMCMALGYMVLEMCDEGPAAWP